MTTAVMSANVEGRGVSVSCSSVPGEGRCPESALTIVAETLNVCRMTQSMIDIAAKQLFGLRQCQTSEDLIQKEICGSEVCLKRTSSISSSFLFCKIIVFVSNSRTAFACRLPSKLKH